MCRGLLGLKNSEKGNWEENTTGSPKALECTEIRLRVAQQVRLSGEMEDDKKWNTSKGEEKGSRMGRDTSVDEILEKDRPGFKSHSFWAA